MILNFKAALLIIISLLPGIESAASDNPAQERQTPGMNIKYLALGDSYTIGESVANAERWPLQLTASMENDGFRFKSVQIIAHTGWTTDELIRGITSNMPAVDHDLVSLLIGVNNQYRGQTVDESRKDFIALLDSAVAFAGGDKDRVFVVSIPDWGVTPFASNRDSAKIAREIDQYNTDQEAICKRRGILYIPITDISREGISDPELVAADGLHPSGKMYRRWVEERIKPKLMQLLQ